MKCLKILSHRKHLRSSCQGSSSKYLQNLKKHLFRKISKSFSERQDIFSKEKFTQWTLKIFRIKIPGKIDNIRFYFLGHGFFFWICLICKYTRFIYYFLKLSDVNVEFQWNWMNETENKIHGKKWNVNHLFFHFFPLFFRFFFIFLSKLKFLNFQMNKMTYQLNTCVFSKFMQQWMHLIDPNSLN